MAQLGDPAQYALGGSYPDKQGVRWTDLATDPQLSGSEPRKAWLMTRNHVGSDVLASSAAALAAVAGVFQTVDYAYAELALVHAASLMAFAELGAEQPHSYCDYVPCTVNRVVNRTVRADSKGGGQLHVCLDCLRACVSVNLSTLFALLHPAPAPCTLHPALHTCTLYPAPCTPHTLHLSDHSLSPCPAHSLSPCPAPALPLLLLPPQALARATVLDTADSIPTCYYVQWTTSSCLIGDTLDKCIVQRVKSVDVSTCYGCAGCGCECTPPICRQPGGDGGQKKGRISYQIDVDPKCRSLSSSFTLR